MIGAQPHSDRLPPAIERDDAGLVVTGSEPSPAALAALDRRPHPLETGDAG